jgi:hypothetical protein
MNQDLITVPGVCLPKGWGQHVITKKNVLRNLLLAPTLGMAWPGFFLFTFTYSGSGSHRKEKKEILSPGFRNKKVKGKRKGVSSVTYFLVHGPTYKFLLSLLYCDCWAVC